MNPIEFKALVEKNGLEFKQCSPYHFQIKGKFLLNFYPSKNTCYLDKTNKGFKIESIEELIIIANNFPEDKLEPSKRNKSPYTKYKLKLLAMHPYCHYCKVKLTRQTGTVDHLIPLAKGGLNNSNNYVLSCEPCNLKKGDKV